MFQEVNSMQGQIDALANGGFMSHKNKRNI